MLRFLSLLPFAVALAGCVTTSARDIDDDARAKLQAENKSVVLLHTSLHDARCHAIEALLAQRDASGRWVQHQRADLRGLYDPQVPSVIKLAAGEYGIVQLMCMVGNRRNFFNARVAQRGSILDGSGAIWERPIATFKVGSGEVVDIGSLRLPTRPGASSGFLRREPDSFIGVVTPIPEAWLNNLAIANPKLTKDRIVRPMEAAIRI
jgi:hypothetical protein